MNYAGFHNMLGQSNVFENLYNVKCKYTQQNKMSRTEFDTLDNAVATPVRKYASSRAGTFDGAQPRWTGSRVVAYSSRGCGTEPGRSGNSTWCTDIPSAPLNATSMKWILLGLVVSKVKCGCAKIHHQLILDSTVALLPQVHDRRSCPGHREDQLFPGLLPTAVPASDWGAGASVRLGAEEREAAQELHTTSYFHYIK